MRLRLAFDLDGTLLDSNGCDYEDPASVLAKTTAHQKACELVRRAYEEGHSITYITGRCHHVRDITALQLANAGLPVGRLYTQTTWLGYDAMAAYKAEALREVRAHLYVGDHQADADAAMLAGVPFHHADLWRNGHLPHGILPITNNGEIIGYERASVMQ